MLVQNLTLLPAVGTNTRGLYWVFHNITVLALWAPPPRGSLKNKYKMHCVLAAPQFWRVNFYQKRCNLHMRIYGVWVEKEFFGTYVKKVSVFPCICQCSLLLIRTFSLRTKNCSFPFWVNPFHCHAFGIAKSYFDCRVESRKVCSVTEIPVISNRYSC
jgi:hypothetical protein